MGNHRWQRVSPTERRGRVHTSSITVALLEDNELEYVDIRPDEVRIETIRGSGKGDQHRNVTDSCVVMTHYATGIKVMVDGRDQHQNRKNAFKEMATRVNHFYKTGYILNKIEERRDQIGIGARSDKRRTYRVKDGLVIDHISGKTAQLKYILRGKINLLK